MRIPKKIIMLPDIMRFKECSALTETRTGTKKLETTTIKKPKGIIANPTICPRWKYLAFLRKYSSSIETRDKHLPLLDICLKVRLSFLDENDADM